VTKYQGSISPVQAGRAIVASILLVVTILVLAVRDTTTILSEENQRLRDQVVLLTTEQSQQQKLIEDLANELSVELEGLRSETTTQIEAARKTVAATKEELENAIEEGKEVTLTEVVNAWRGRIAFIQCEFNFLGARLTQRGAATFFVFDDTPTLVTNRHVVEGFSGDFVKCHYRFPKDDDNIQFPESVIAFGASDELEEPDYATVELTSPNPYVRTLQRTAQAQICATRPQIGDEVIILGFPTIGSSRDVTATEGIIAAVEENYYVTSAKVDSGNSGGAAIHVEDQCYLGIPTFTALGQAESLARILRADQIDF